MNEPIILILVAVIPALGAYLAASRRLSGNIQTSEASSLWAESADIRKDYRDRLAHAEERLASAEARIARAESENTDLRRENTELKGRNADLARACERLRARIEEVERENQSLKNTIRRALPDA